MVTVFECLRNLELGNLSSLLRLFKKEAMPVVPVFTRKSLDKTVGCDFPSVTV
jgi:hypothetical protein